MLKVPWIVNATMVDDFVVVMDPSVVDVIIDAAVVGEGVTPRLLARDDVAFVELFAPFVFVILIVVEVVVVVIAANLEPSINAVVVVLTWTAAVVAIAISKTVVDNVVIVLGTLVLGGTLATKAKVVLRMVEEVNATLLMLELVVTKVVAKVVPEADVRVADVVACLVTKVVVELPV